MDLSAGQLVADKYRIDGVIGAGGMGVVLAATHLDLDQLVAIKVLRDASEEAIARFQREARMIVRLKSVHVARVFDVGVLDDDTPYFVMERLEGEDLAKMLEKKGPLPVEQAVDYVLEACEAVAEAHTLGMVHRDLKPANLYVARGPGGTGSVKVLDFGISKAVQDANQPVGELTNEGVAMGSPGYMSPEQIQSTRDVDARADIYSLGAILYRLTSGQTPHKGETLMSILASMASTPLRPLDAIAKVPPDFAKVVARCLDQDRDARPKTIADVAVDIAPFGTRRSAASLEQILATMGVVKHPSSSKRASAPALTEDAETTPRAGVEVEQVPTLTATVLAPLTPPVPVIPQAHISTDRRPRAKRPNPNIVPLGLAGVFVIAIGYVALRSPTPRPPPPPAIAASQAVPTPLVTADPPSSVVELAPPAPSSVDTTPKTQPKRHGRPAPPPPAPKKPPPPSDNLSDLPGGRH
jgi:serine/threonine-protein kinase